MAVEVEDVLAVWREAERALESLPEEAPERPIIQIQVARLRRLYLRMTNEAVPATWNLITATRDAIADTKAILGDAEARIQSSHSMLTGPERLMTDWLLAEQALTRAGDDPARRSELLLAADEARERYQAAIDELGPDRPG
jgi:hypothetical protein